MNTLGKILVVLNLVFTVAMFAFIVFFYAAARGQYTENFEKQKREVIVSRAAVKGHGDVNRTLKAKYTQAVAERDKLKRDFDDMVIEKNAKITEQAIDIDMKTKELEKQNVLLTAMQEEIKRRNKEVEDLGVALKSRETAILKLEEESRGYRQEAISERLKAETAQARAEQLLEQIRQMTVNAAKEGVGVATNQVKRPNEPNPPPALVKGSVERVEKADPDTVLLSVGSDQGLERSHTLYAYRMDPEPTYLGLIRIVDVHHDSAVGRLERSSVSRRIPLRAGDKVISDLKSR